MGAIRRAKSRILTPVFWYQAGEQVDRHTGGLWTLVRSTIVNYGRHGCSMRAAAIAYYILLSFFPTVVLLVVLASSFLTSSRAKETVYTFIDRYLPVADQLVQLNIERLLANRGWASVLSVLGLLFFAIYRLLSTTPLRWWELVPSSVIVAVLWELAKQLITGYVTTFRPYNVVYGSLGRFIAFTIWSYMSAVMLLFGAELAIAWRHLRDARTGRPSLVRAWLKTRVKRNPRVLT